MTSSPRPANLFFLPRVLGQRLCVYHGPASDKAPLAALVFVHACGEEMNKSRHMVALQARALSRAGCAVLTIDLLGCGDSSGDLQDASWSDWLADIEAACNWMTEHLPQTPIWLWGQRAGALLASAVAQRRTRPTHLLLWQPLVSGKPQVQQLLRMKAAAGLGAGMPAGEAITDIKQALAQGGAVEIGGYTWPAALMQALESAMLERPVAPGRVAWIEVSNRPDPSLAPTSSKLLETWRGLGAEVDSRAVRGPAFWQTTELEVAPELLSATVSAVLQAPGLTA